MLFLSVFFSLSLRLSDSLSLSLDLSIPQHSRCIDTALIYPHPKGKTYKFSLKSLGERYLGRKIQTKESGHDSIEDASCAMQLCRLKLLFGPTFGEHEFEGESICSILTRHNKYARGLNRSMLVPFKRLCADATETERTRATAMLMGSAPPVAKSGHVSRGKSIEY